MKILNAFRKLRKFWNRATPVILEIDWTKEVDFWFTKHNRAFIRYQDAMERGDKNAADIAMNQMELYRRRLNAAIPDDVKARNDARRQEELHAALNEL